jgi:hypothetical protein
MKEYSKYKYLWVYHDILVRLDSRRKSGQTMNDVITDLLDFVEGKIKN